MFGRSGSKEERAAAKAAKQAAKAGAKTFGRMSRADKRVVVYAEGRHDWPHLGGIVKELTSTHGMPVVYLTSEADDPVLTAPPDGVTPLAIGDGLGRAMLFQTMEAGQLVTTLPDIGQLELKRSKFDVHYVYVFHALVSTHMVYREGAFDHYDTVLTVGPHHDAEIRAREAQKGLPQKRLVPHGYGRLDALLATSDSAGSRRNADDPAHVLVAGSWGPNALMENPAGHETCRRLLDIGLKVTVRLHPMTVRHHPAIVRELEDAFDANPQFTVETDLTDSTSLRTSDVMISDWSGASFDYAFGQLRPVVYVDMPPKVNNPKWAELGIEPLEMAIRSDIGACLDPSELEGLPETVQRLSDGNDQAARLADLRAETLHHVGDADEVAAAWITAATS